MAGFTGASVLCGLARNPAELVGGRLLQGLAAAIMVPQVLALITAIFPAGDRPRALAWFGVTAGVSGLCGQVLGGLVLSADVLGLAWRAIFFLNLPVGALVLALAPRLIPVVLPLRRARLDLPGVAGVSAALALALAPLILGQEQGWPAWTWACLAASVPVMITDPDRFVPQMRQVGLDVEPPPDDADPVPPRSPNIALLDMLTLAPGIRLSRETATGPLLTVRPGCGGG
jgi:MFS family permease